MSRARYYHVLAISDSHTHCIQQTDTMPLLHNVMGQSLRFDAHVTCSLLPRLTHTLYSIQHTECSICYTLCWDELYRSMHMSHAIRKHVGDSHIHCIQQTEAVVVTHCVRTSFTVQCMSQCSLLQRVLGTHTHTVFNKRNAAVVTHCDGMVFTV